MSAAWSRRVRCLAAVLLAASVATSGGVAGAAARDTGPLASTTSTSPAPGPTSTRATPTTGAATTVSTSTASTSTTVPLAPPKAWILVDADTGKVIDAGNDRTPLPPASLTKVITALAAGSLDPSTPITVSAPAAAAPADKINLKQGQVWTADELFHALLISSANDAAVALAEQVGGSLAGFQPVFAQTALGLGMADDPVLMDPAGLDGPEGVDGGNLISARDLAIAGRALLAVPYLAAIVATPIYYFNGPDGIQHRLTSHNYAFLKTYPGAIGIKTGYTVRAGTCLMAAARVGGRTMLAVVLRSPNPGAAVKALLDKGFATPIASEPTADRLPAIDLDALPAPTATTTTTLVGPPVQTVPTAPPTRTAAAAGTPISATGTSESFLLLAGGGALALLMSLAVVIASAIRRRRSRGSVPSPR